MNEPIEKNLDKMMIEPSDDIRRAAATPIPIVIFNAYGIQAQDFAKLPCETDENAGNISKALGLTKTWMREIDDAEETAKRPFALMLDRIRNAFRPIRTEIRKGNETMGEKLLLWKRYKDAVERERLERKRVLEQEEVRRKAEKAETLGFAQEPETVRAAVDAVPERQPVPVKAIKTEESRTQFKKNWTWELENLGAFLGWVLENIENRGALVEPTGAVTRGVKARTLRTVPGLRIWAEDVVAR